MPATDRTPSTAVVTVTRTFAAPRDLVFRACTEAPLMSQWFARGPKMPEGKILELDPRPGGRYLVEVVSNMDGRTYRMQGTYREVIRPSRVSFTWWYDLADFDESLVTIDLRDTGKGHTELTLTHSLLPDRMLEPHRQGWEECLNALVGALPAR